ncbi:MAG: ribonucleotide-diphosphate reductase subunit beta [Firmicutes bacterium]|nr:ribonucleotide-diphosphate reductase subunit beta [Bacillota bacterium]
MERLTRSPLFHPDGPRRPQGLVGETTYLLELTGCRYPWADRLYRKMRDLYWKPDDVNLVADHAQFAQLTPGEQETFLNTLGFLIYLDSIQAQNPAWLTQYMAAPEVSACLLTQAFFETIHAQSYDHLLSSLVDGHTRERVYRLWRDHPVLAERNRTLVEPYEAFYRHPTLEGLATLCFADVLLEGLYFWSGFSVFLTLASRHLMTGTAQLIRQIRRDEQHHLALYIQLIRTLRAEAPDVFTDDLAAGWQSLAIDAARREIAWMCEITRQGFEGLSPETIAAYVEWLANQRLEALGIAPVFPAATHHPLPWLERLGEMNAGKADFFEQAVVNYQDDLDFSQI